MHFQTRVWSRRLFVRGAIRDADLYHSTEAAGTPRLGVRRLVVTCHDLIPTVLGGEYLRRTPRWVSRVTDVARYRFADRVIAISEATRADVCRTLGIPKERVSVIHHGVDHDRFKPSGAPEERSVIAKRVGTDRPYFLFVGAADGRKRVSSLIDAYAECAPDLDEDLVIAGQLDAVQKENLRMRAFERGVHGRVRLVGFVPREVLPSLYRCATAHVLPSVYEGFGMTLLEAMACGTAVVACPVTSMPEVCGDAAFWVTPDSAPSLAEGLRTVASDTPLRAEHVRRGIERAALFTWDRAARATLDVYRSVLGS